MVNTIRTNERIFEVTNYEGNIYLCNLEHFDIDTNGNLLGAENESIIRVKHYWNNAFKKISKRDIKDMILAQRETTKTT